MKARDLLRVCYQVVYTAICIILPKYYTQSYKRRDCITGKNIK